MLRCSHIEMHRSVSFSPKRERKNCYQKKNQLSKASHLQVHTEMNTFFNFSARDGLRRPRDNVDGWCFNAAECYFFFLLNMQNYKFWLHCQWSYPMHKSVARPRRPWIIASHGRCYFAETNSSDKICRRLIVYSCFMAQCNLNTFMISLKSLHEANAHAQLRQQGESQALCLHLDSSPPSYSLLPLCKLMEATRIFIVRGAVAFNPPTILSVCLSFFLSCPPFSLHASELFRSVQMSCVRFSCLLGGNWKWPAVTLGY